METDPSLIKNSDENPFTRISRPPRLTSVLASRQLEDKLPETSSFNDSILTLSDEEFKQLLMEVTMFKTEQPQLKSSLAKRLRIESTLDLTPGDSFNTRNQNKEEKKDIEDQNKEEKKDIEDQNKEGKKDIEDQNKEEKKDIEDQNKEEKKDIEDQNKEEKKDIEDQSKEQNGFEDQNKEEKNDFDVKNKEKKYIEAQNKEKNDIEDQNKEGKNDQLKRFPLLPWPRPLQVQSFFHSIPLPEETDSKKDDKSAYIDGNPFIKTSRPRSLASFVSTTLLDYNNAGLDADTENPKNKCGKNSVLSESIEGYRGHNDIESLLEYINSSDRKNESIAKGSKNQLLTSKNSLLKEHDKKKSSSKKKRKSKKKSIPSCTNKFDSDQSSFAEKVDISSEIAEKLGFVLVNRLSSDDDSSSTCSLSAEELKTFTILDFSQKQSN